MSLEISEPVTHTADVVLLTFVLKWKERQREKAKDVLYAVTIALSLADLPTED